MVPMRDGVQLAADVYLPSKDGLAAAPGRFPVILSRTPYDKEARDFDPPYGWIRDSVHHGYAAVIQDVRGTHASGGAFNPLMDEGWGEHQDGVDTVAWLVRQAWSDGHVGTSGMSYMGATQMMLALTHPPGYVTGFIEVPAVNQFTESFLYVGGAFNLGATLPWAMMMSRDAAAHLPSPQREAVLDDLASIPDLDWDGKAAIREHVAEWMPKFFPFERSAKGAQTFAQDAQLHDQTEFTNHQSILAPVDAALGVKS